MKFLERIIEWGTYLFVFLLPWQTRLIIFEGNLNGYWEYGTISLYATEILLVGIFILSIVRLAIRRGKKTVPKPDTAVVDRKTFYTALIIFLIYPLASLAWADSKILAVYRWHWLVEGACLLFLLRTIKISPLKLVWAFVLSAVFQAGLGIWQFLSQSTFASKWLGMAAHDPIEPGTYVVETSLRRWLRAYGSLPHPNMLAFLSAAAMIAVVWLYQNTEHGFKKLFLPIIFSILGLGVLVTFSKSIIISFLAAAVSYWIIVLVQRQSWEAKINLLKFTLIFLIITGVFSAIFWEPVSTRIVGTERLETKSTGERIGYLTESWEIIKKHPVLGVGLGNYTLAVHNEINPDLRSWEYQPVHNIYLLIIAELGVAGFILWLALMFFILRGSFILFSPIIVFVLGAGFFDHYLWTLYFGIILFWLIFGVICPKTLDSSLDRQ